MDDTHITKVTPLPGYRLRIRFRDGKVKTVSLENRLGGPIMGPLRKLSVFRKVRIEECGGLEWPNGADICPDLLYYGGSPPWAAKPLMADARAMLRKIRATLKQPCRKQKVRQLAKQVWEAAALAADALVGCDKADGLQVFRAFGRAWGTEGRMLAANLNAGLYCGCFLGNGVACDRAYVTRYAIQFEKILKKPIRDRRIRSRLRA